MKVEEYLKKYGNKSFKEIKLNEIDMAIFSIISYVIFDDLKEEVLSIALEKILSRAKTYFDKLYRGIGLKDFLIDCKNAQRYENITISDYIDLYSKEEEKQFSALVFHLSKNKHLVAFRGTDKKIIAWKEDLHLSFNSLIPSQKEASKYLKKILIKHPGRLILTGHSKGGNLAIYAASTLDKVNLFRIQEIHNFDGPGFNFKACQKEDFLRLEKKIINYYPKHSIFGMILDAVGQAKFIQTDAFGLLQHDILNWKVRKEAFLKTKQSTFSIFIHSLIDELIKNADEESKKAFADDLFNLLGAQEDIDFSKINSMTSILKYLSKINDNYKNLDKKTQADLKNRLSKLYLISKDVYKKMKNN